MTKHGRGGGTPVKGNPGGYRGGNRGDAESKYQEPEPPLQSSPSAGKDPHRGKPLEE